MLYQIYLITNKVNQKKYIGQTNQGLGYEGRFKKHCGGIRDEKPTKLLSKAFKKYGIENFSLDLVEDNIPEDLIDEREIFYIKKYNSYYLDGYGYNMTKGGQGVHGYKHTSETKAKVSCKSKAYWKDLKENRPEEYNQLIMMRSKKMKGIPKSDIAKKHLSEAAQRKIHSPGYVNPFKGRHHTDQVREIISQKNGIRVGMYDPNTLELIMEFKNAEEATKYLLEHGLTTNKSAKSRIFYVCDNPNRIAYGFRWKKLS